MWRQLELVFFGQPRTEAAAHAHESGPVMTIPLVALAVLSVLGGFFNTPSNVLGLDGIFGAHVFTDFLEHSVVHAHAAQFQPVLAVGALGLALFAIVLARSIYGGGRALVKGSRDPLAVRPETGGVWNLAHARLYWDEAYFRLFENPFNRTANFLANTVNWDFWHDYFHNTIIAQGFNAIGRFLSRPVDLGVIDGIVNGIGRVVRWTAGRARGIQTGYVRTYAVTLMLGVVLVIVILLLPLFTNGGA
jgi:NADH-quinone oxidoreductase subunit L